jgi:hypothetical protein
MRGNDKLMMRVKGKRSDWIRWIQWGIRTDAGIGARDIAWWVGVRLGGGDRNDVIGSGDRAVCHIGVEEIVGSEW